MLQIEVIQEHSRWKSEFATWNRMAQDNFMLQSSWLESWWHGFAADRQLYILKAKDESGRALGFLPLCMSSSLMYGKQLDFLGGPTACSDDLSMICEEGLEQPCARAFSQFLATACGGLAWDRLNLDGVQLSNPRTFALQQQLKAADIALLDKPGPSCWKVSLEGGWNGVVQRVKKSTRRLLRNLLRDYLETGRGKLVLPTSLNDALAQVHLTADMHQRRWKQLNQSGCFADSNFHTFVMQVAERYWSQNRLYSAVLELDGQVAAGTFGVWSSGTLSIYFVGMDPDKKQHRPGWMLNVASMLLAIDRGIQVYDFMRGDEEYKDRIGAEPTTQTRWVAAAPRFLPRVRHAAYVLGTTVRDWAKETTAAKSKEAVAVES